MYKKVKIKTWEQMEKEFGLDAEGDIDISNEVYFVTTMENHIPVDRIIEVYELSDGREEMYWEIEDSEWIIVSEMIEVIIKD